MLDNLQFDTENNWAHLVRQKVRVTEIILHSLFTNDHQGQYLQSDLH